MEAMDKGTAPGAAPCWLEAVACGAAPGLLARRGDLSVVFGLWRRRVLCTDSNRVLALALTCALLLYSYDVKARTSCTLHAADRQVLVSNINKSLDHAKIVLSCRASEGSSRLQRRSSASI